MRLSPEALAPSLARNLGSAYLVTGSEPLLIGEACDAIRAAAELLADRVEGNLLAAQQEIERIALQMPGATRDADQVAELVADSARYDVFELSEAGRHERGDALCAAANVMDSSATIAAEVVLVARADGKYAKS